MGNLITPQTGQVGGGLTNSMFESAAQNPLIAPMDLSQASIAGQMGANGGGINAIPQLLQALGKGTQGFGQAKNASSQGGGGGGSQGMNLISGGLSSGASILTALSALGML